MTGDVIIFIPEFFFEVLLPFLLNIYKYNLDKHGITMTWYKVGREESLKDGDLAKASAGGHEVLIIRDGDKFYATSHLCTHEEYDLADAFLDDHQLICPNHFATFDPKDGSVINPPEGAGDISPLKTFSLKVENGDIMVEF